MAEVLKDPHDFRKYVQELDLLLSRPSPSLTAHPHRRIFAATTPENKVVVVKAQRKEGPAPSALADFANEQRVLGDPVLSSHPNIIKAFGSFEDEHYKMIVVEYVAGGDLIKFIHKYSPVEESRTKRFAVHILSALRHLHFNGHFHGDVKAENILIRKPAPKDESSWEFVLADMEFCCKTSERRHCGSPAYVAPELLDKSGCASPASDMWSFAVTLYAMLAAQVPFFSENGSLSARLQLQRRGWLPLKQNWSRTLRVLFIDLFAISPDARPSAADVLAGDWLARR